MPFFFDGRQYFYSWFRWIGSYLLGQRIPPAGAGCPIAWQPSVLAPVFYGVREHAQPSPCRVFFPSLDGAPTSAPLLEGCGRYPLILLAHGHCNELQHYMKWYELPARLASCGNIVVVPELPETLGGTYPWDNTRDLPVITAILSWMRNMSPYRHMLLPGRTGILGHSYGAVIGARFAAANATSAFASLSGDWMGWPAATPHPLRALAIPTLHTWGLGGDVNAPLSDALFGALATPRHKAVFDGGEHWDYLPAGRTTCDQARGTCDVVHVVATDLVCTFFGKYMPPEGWPTLGTIIPDSLIAPALSLTFEQQFFAGNNLMGLSLMTGRAGCRVTISWQNRSGQGGSVARP
jgi:hypothetical protein